MHWLQMSQIFSCRGRIFFRVQFKQVWFESEFKMCRLSTVMISMGISSTSIAFSKGTKPIDQSLPFSVLAQHDRCTCLNQMPSHCDLRILYC